MSEANAGKIPDIAALIRATTESRRTLQLLVALAPEAAALLDPSQPAGGIAGLVGFPLIRAGMQPGPMGRLLGILCIHSAGVYRRARGRRGRGGLWRCGRFGLCRFRGS